MRRLLLLTLATALAVACQTTTSDVPPDADAAPKSAGESAPETRAEKPASTPATSTEGEGTSLAPAAAEGEAVATFAGGCFWCMEGPFEKLDGVRAVLSGYTGGPENRPTYRQVAGKQTGHTEAVIVYYDPAKVTYEKLLDTFWRSMDPTDAEGQFADRGASYRPAIFVHTPEQKAAALKSKADLEASGRFAAPIVVPILDAQQFWVAEEYHQDYYKKNPEHYERYRRGSGRSGFLAKTWGDGSNAPDMAAPH